MYQKKSVSINKALHVNVTAFQASDLETYPQLLGEGKYGKVRFGKLVSFQQKVAVKELSVGNALDVEAKIMQVLNGHKSFPMLFGWIKEINSIKIQEFSY